MGVALGVEHLTACPGLTARTGQGGSLALYREDAGQRELKRDWNKDLECETVYR